MSDYNKFVATINKIFELIGKLKVSIKDQDNLNYISNIEEYKDLVLKTSTKFSKDIKW